MTESLDRETWQARVAAWWQATAPDWRDALARLGADTAYGLLTASAFLPLLEVYSPDHPGPALAALSELISDVGTELLSSLAQGAYDKAHASRRVEQEIAEHPDLRAEYQALLDRLDVLRAAQDALGAQWDDFQSELTAELTKMGGGLHLTT